MVGPRRIKVEKRSRAEWQKDKKCYFLIRYDSARRVIEVRVMNHGHEPLVDYEGDDPEDVYYRIIKDGYVTNLQHAAYLGCELQKVFIAMKKNLKYVQDDPLDF